MFTRVLAAVVAAVASSTAVGCQGPDASGPPGEWSFSGANAANLATMIDNPADLVRGRGDGRVSGQLAAAAAIRLRRDQVKPLPSIDTSQFSQTSGGAQQGSAPAAADVQ